MPTKELQVLELISQYGPCTLDELTSAGAFTRSSVYRSLTKLESCGWVRRSLDGRRYVLSSKIERVLDQASFPTRHAEYILDSIKENSLNAKYRLALVHHVRGGALEIVDTTGTHADALNMMLDVQESIPRIVNAMMQCGRDNSAEGQTGLAVVRVQDFLPDSGKDGEWFLIDDHSQIAIITIHSKADGLFLLLCASRNAVRFGRDSLADYCRSLCRSLAALNGVGGSEMHAAEPRRRNLIRLGT
jgi:hypothetical protein